MHENFVDEAANFVKDLPNLLVGQIKELVNTGEVEIDRNGVCHQPTNVVMPKALENVARGLRNNGELKND